MINLFRKHPKENGYSGYLSHFAFAFAVSLRLSIVSTYIVEGKENLYGKNKK
jgi:hypothetical protein